MGFINKNKNQLIVIWTNSTVSFNYGGSVHTELDVDIDSDLKTLIMKAKETLKFNGNIGHIYYEGSNVEHIDIETPPINKESDYSIYIDQMISRKKIVIPFDEYSYSYINSSNKKKSSIIMDVYNKNFTDVIISSFKNEGIHINVFSSLMSLLLNLKLDVNHKDSPTILLGAFNNGNVVVYTYYDYLNETPVMCRYTPPFLGISEAVSEINRGVDYGKQVFSGSVPNVVSLGDYFNDLEIILEHVDYHQYGSDFTFVDSSRVSSINTTLNIIPSSERNSHTKDVYKRVSYITSTIFFVLSISLFVMINSLTDSYNDNIITEQKLSDTKRNIESKIIDYEDKVSYNKKLLIENDYTSYSKLRDIVNTSSYNDVVFNEFIVEYKGNRLLVYIRGYVTIAPRDASKMLLSLQKELENEHHVIITTSWTKNWLSSIEKWRNLIYGKDNTKKVSIPFSISGYVLKK